MALGRREEKPGWAQRIGGAAMTVGVMVLLGGLVSAFVVVGVVLLNRPGGSGKPVPIVGSSKPTASTAYRPVAESRIRPPASEPPSPKDPRAISAAPAPKPKSKRVLVDDKGYIRQWLLLAPIPCDRENYGGKEIRREQVSRESRLRVKAGQKQKTRKGNLVWFAHNAPSYYIDFKKAVAGGKSEDVVGYAVCYLRSKEAVKYLRLEMRSNDQGLVYLNGKRLLRHDESRTVETGVDVAKSVRLNKGINTLVFKVVNEKNNWQGSIRLLDKNGKPFRDYEVAVAP